VRFPTTGRGLGWFFLTLIVLLTGALGVAAEKVIRPTFVRDTKVSVPRGGEVEITLQAIPSYGNDVTFEIVTTPGHGTLSNLNNSSDHTATVIYHHDGSKDPLLDRFDFRAKAPGQSKSSAATVAVGIIPPPPHLSFDPPSLDFGSTLLSEKSRTNVVIKNLGGSRAAGRLVLPVGFTAPDGSVFHLEEGESASLAIEFSPLEQKEYEAWPNCLPSVVMDPLVLRGRGHPRFKVASESETGWKISNLSRSPIRITFEHCGDAAPWFLPAETLIPAGSQQSFSAQQVEDEERTNAVSKTSGIRITDGLSSSTVELPPSRRFIPLTVKPLTSPSLGSLPIGGTIRVSFSLTNRSDLLKKATWKISSVSGGGMDHEEEVNLPGGESKDFHHDWKPSLPGEAELKLVVEEGRKTRHELLWNATIAHGVPPDPGTQNREGEPPPPEMIGRESIPLNQAAASPRDGTPLPPVDDAHWGVSSPWFGRPMAFLKWKAKVDDASRMSVEEVVLVPAGKNSAFSQSGTPPAVTNAVIPVKAVPLHKEGEMTVMVLPDLSPGWHLILLSRTTPEGNPEAQSRLQMIIPPKPSWWSLVKMPISIMAILLLIFLLRGLRREGA
jgi:hypothetical protein